MINDVGERCNLERRYLQQRLPSNYHAIVVLVEERGNGKRTIAYSATDTHSNVEGTLGEILQQLQSDPFR